MVIKPAIADCAAAESRPLRREKPHLFSAKAMFRAIPTLAAPALVAAFSL